MPSRPAPASRPALPVPAPAPALASAPAPAPAARVPALVLLCVLNHLAMVGARVAVALQALALELPAIGVGALLAAFALVPLLAGLAMGRWIDRRGARRPAGVGLLASVSGLAAAACVTTPAALAAAGLLAGGGHALASLALQDRLAARPEPARSAAFRWFGAGTALSIGGGPFIAGHAFEQGGAALAFGLLAALPALAWVGVVAGAAGPWAGCRLPVDAGTLPTASGPPDVQAAGRSGGVLHLAAVRRVLVVDLLLALGWTANGLLVPLLAAAQGWPAGWVGNLGAAFGIGVGLVRLAGLRWPPAAGDWALLRFSLAASALCYALLPMSARLAAHGVAPWPAWFPAWFPAWLPTPLVGPAAACVVQALLGAALGLALPSVLALLVRDAPPSRRAEVLGLRTTLLNASGLALPLLLGLGAATGVAALAWAVGGGLAAGLAAARERTAPPADRLAPARCPRP